MLASSSKAAEVASSTGQTLNQTIRVRAPVTDGLTLRAEGRPENTGKWASCDGSG
jgi:hypothetical protein